MNQILSTGEGALLRNLTGSSNTATGKDVLNNNTIGDFNIAIGRNAGDRLTTGNNNIDIANRGVAGESSFADYGRRWIAPGRRSVKRIEKYLPGRSEEERASVKLPQPGEPGDLDSVINSGCGKARNHTPGRNRIFTIGHLCRPEVRNRNPA